MTRTAMGAGEAVGMAVNSCLYVGTVRHRRAHPPSELRHRVALVYIDLDELRGLVGGGLVAARPGLIRVRRGDYHGDPSTPLDTAVRDTVQARTGRRPRGPIRLLAYPRAWGHCFNPVSLYYCFDERGERIEALLAEVTNTPWGERHAYVLASERPESPVLRASFDKALHVSPFMGMDHVYRCHAALPGETLSVHVQSARGGTAVFDATLALRRRGLTPGSLRWLAARFPFATIRVLALIYGHAARLRLAGARAFAHPGRAGA